ncbi:hypothetical protein RI065_10955 [Mycoplasmatota bacterium zrk1]
MYIRLASTIKIHMLLNDGNALSFIPSSRDEIIYVNTQHKKRTHYNSQYDEDEYYRLLEKIIDK